MAPRGTTSQSSSSRTVETPTTDTAEIAANQQAEIERLTALLQAAEAKAALTDYTSAPPAEQTTATLLESIVRSIGSLGSPSSTKLGKIPDPPIFTDGKDPTFDS
jgi:hypothetical protein